MVLNVALAFNLIEERYLEGRPLDSIAELDSHETIKSLKTALESGGHNVTLINADDNFHRGIRNPDKPIDMVFNIAEGIRGESRESHVPSICEMLGIPYTGSGPLTLALCLNKARTKEILGFHGIPTPDFQVFRSSNEKLKKELKYPLIVKLLHEGSSMGLSYDSVVYNEKDLRSQIKRLISTYQEPVIVEEFLPGREFTIPIMGNGDPLILPIVEVLFKGRVNINLFNPDESVISIIKKYTDEEIPRSQTDSVCPAKIPKKLENRLREMALNCYKIMECRDWCRMEFRLDEDGTPKVLELNPIPGIDPTYWFPKSAYAMGMTYNQLINKILNYALGRYGIKK